MCDLYKSPSAINFPLLGRGRGFESHQVYQVSCPSWSKGADLRSAGLRSAWVQIPQIPLISLKQRFKKNLIYVLIETRLAPLAQLVEHRAYDAGVTGSIPVWSTFEEPNSANNSYTLVVRLQC